MRILSILIFSFILASSYAQEQKTEFDGHHWNAPYQLSIPKDWTIERFLIPISFAPQISYKGVEDIRFPPGWGKTDSEEYWSYAFLWYLDGNVTLDVKTIEKNLKAYYTGLIKINGNNIPADKIIPVETSFKKNNTEHSDKETYEGTIKMLDYMQQKPVMLYCKVHMKKYDGEDKTFIFYELSPQPATHKIWKDLHQLWMEFKLKK